MQDVNDDMDDMFRKAAEQYPLKTDGANWQKVLAGLQDASMPAVAEKEKRKRRALWLFLLLPLGLLWMMYYYKGDNQSTQQAAVVKDVVTNKSGNDVINNKAGNNVKNEVSNNDSQKLSFELDKKTLSVAESTNNSAIVSSSTEANNNLKSSNKNTTNFSSGNKKNTTSTTTENGLNTHTKGFAFSEGKKENFDYKQADVTKNSRDINDDRKNFPALQPEASSDRIDKQDAQADNTVEAKAGEAVQSKKDSVVLNNIKADSAANNNAGNENKSKMVKAKLRKQTGFYAGILASLDVSTIKLQRINKAGHGFELLVGYRFSKRLSVESGVNWTDKQYYSTGKYFDKTNTGIPTESKIIFTNGSCNMFEIPATVKYDFLQKKKSSWFATAGLSSYIMKDEKYNYYANHTGNYYNATKKYSHSGNNLFSVASLSIGYQLQLNKHLSLRAEPYIKMPLGGIGIAKMPITSTGIAVGFTRSF